MIKRTKKRCTECGLERYIWSKGRCKICAQKAYAKKKTNGKSKRNFLKRTKRKKKKTEFEKYRDILDYVMSMWTRLRFSDSSGRVKCYTCSYVGFWKKDKIECGHFISRKNMSVRFHPDNMRPQCRTCNQLRSGHIKVFEKNLRAEIGEQKVDALKALSKQTKLFTVEEFKEIKKIYNEKIKNLKAQKHI